MRWRRWLHPHATRGTYWSSSVVAHRIYAYYGIAKPRAATMDDWDAWHQTTEAAHPYVYALVERHFRNLQDLIFWPTDVLSLFRIWWRNRVTHPQHLIRTGLTKGVYHPRPQRILYGLFQELCDLVELEKAQRQAWADPVPPKKCIQDRLPKRRRTLRSPERGLAHLDWEADLDAPANPEAQWNAEQAATARELRALYRWWIQDRPARPDPDRLAGVEAWYAAYPSKVSGHRRFRMCDQTEEYPQDTEALYAAMDAARSIRAQYREEDQTMLQRLVQQRERLES